MFLLTPKTTCQASLCSSFSLVITTLRTQACSLMYPSHCGPGDSHTEAPSEDSLKRKAISISFQKASQ